MKQPRLWAELCAAVAGRPGGLCRVFGSREAAKPRSREGRRKGRGSVFEYEYRFTEYEYEVRFFGGGFPGCVWAGRSRRLHQQSQFCRSSAPAICVLAGYRGAGGR